MIEIKAWQKELLNQIGEKAKSIGFGYRKDQEFWRIVPFGKLFFHLSFIPHHDDFDVTLDLAIRFNDVEEIRNADNRRLTAAEKSETCTMGCEVGNLTRVGQKRWNVSSFETISSVASSIMEDFIKIGLPYFEEFSNPERALDVLSGDTRDSWVHSAFDDKRATSAVILALLHKGKDAAKQLAVRKMAYLEERNDCGLPDFRSFLEKHSLLCY